MNPLQVVMKNTMLHTGLLLTFFFFLSFLPHSFSDMIATLELVVVGVDQTAKM